MQLDLFEPRSTTLPSSSPLIGLQIRLPRKCANCGNSVGIIGSSTAMHANRVTCAGCGTFRMWLSHDRANFLTGVSKKFGAPRSIALRQVMP
jgi:ribosomal protein S27AE